VVGDLHVVSSAKLLEETLAAGTAPRSFRVFAGYAGWGAGQLDGELAMGSWHILEGDTGIAFDGHPRTLWERLIKKTEVRFALLTREGDR
jgi:putative transcriptional regulator